MLLHDETQPVRAGLARLARRARWFARNPASRCIRPAGSGACAITMPFSCGLPPLRLAALGFLQAFLQRRHQIDHILAFGRLVAFWSSTRGVFLSLRLASIRSRSASAYLSVEGGGVERRGLAVDQRGGDLQQLVIRLVILDVGKDRIGSRGSRPRNAASPAASRRRRVSPPRDIPCRAWSTAPSPTFPAARSASRTTR